MAAATPSSRAAYDSGVFVGRVVIERDLSAELAARDGAGTLLFVLNAALTVLFAVPGWTARC